MDAFQHSFCVCLTTAAIRDNWWYVITNLFDIRLCAELCGLSETDLYLILLGRNTVYESENKAFRLFNFQLYPQRCCPVLQSSKFAVNVYTTVYYIFPINSCSDITMFCFCFVLFISLCCVSILIFFLFSFPHIVYIKTHWCHYILMFIITCIFTWRK